MTEDTAAKTGAGRKRRWVWGALPVAVVGAAVVLVWFQPQKLFLDERVDSALPGEAGARAVDVARGTFVSREHSTTGVARVLEIGAARFLRLEAFDTSNGPDLYVYLSTNPPDGREGAFDDDFVSLGRLQGNIGDQNYEIPAGVDLARYASVVIWCDGFNAAFGAAPLAHGAGD